MTFWSGEKLETMVGVVTPFDPKDIDYNSYTLRMGGSYYVTADADSKGEQKRTALPEGGSLVIPPGQFAFLLTKESVNVPTNAMAFISMKLTRKLQGLINVSGFNVDPGYSGKLIFGVFNAGASPVHIIEGEELFKIWFCDLDNESGGRFVFKKPGLEEISSDTINRMNKEILSLQSMADRVRKLEQDVIARFAEQKPAVDSLNTVWRLFTTTLMIAIGGSLISIAIALSALAYAWLLPIVESQVPDPKTVSAPLQRPATTPVSSSVAPSTPAASAPPTPSPAP